MARIPGWIYWSVVGSGERTLWTALFMNNSISYPCLVVEDVAHEYTIFKVINSNLGWLPFLRVPVKRQYVSGKVFDASGRIWKYEGESPVPRFPGGRATLTKIADGLIVPALIYKLIGLFTSLEPAKLSLEKEVDPEEFKNSLKESLSRFVSLAELDDLSDRMRGLRDFVAIIQRVEAWIWEDGGREVNDAC